VGTAPEPSRRTGPLWVYRPLSHIFRTRFETYGWGLWEGRGVLESYVLCRLKDLCLFLPSIFPVTRDPWFLRTQNSVCSTAAPDTTPRLRQKSLATRRPHSFSSLQGSTSSDLPRRAPIQTQVRTKRPCVAVRVWLLG